MFWERIPGSWTSVGKGTFSVGWEFIARDVKQAMYYKVEVMTSFTFRKWPSQIG